jgi:hypothetical protein
MAKLKLRKEQLEILRVRLNIPNGVEYKFLGYTLDLEAGSIADKTFHDIRQLEFDTQVISTLLLHYLLGKSSPTTSILTKFSKLPGGYAYEMAFDRRVIQPLSKTFGTKPADLVEAGKLLGGKALKFGDSSLEIPTLEGIPIVLIIWAESEFPATATFLFDQSASSYLPTEDLAILAELVSARIRKVVDSKLI